VSIRINSVAIVVHVIRTSENIQIVKSEGEVVIVAAPTSGKALNLIAVPAQVTVKVAGLPWDITAVLNYSAAEARLTVDELSIKRRPGGDPIPARGLRAFQLQTIVENVAQKAAFKVRIKPGGGGFEPAPKWRIDATTAQHLARGRSKSQESVRHLRAQAVKEYREIKASGEKYPDTYAEIGRRMHVGRTTVYQYLKDAGEITRYRS
jgi:hypothetical protein